MSKLAQIKAEKYTPTKWIDNKVQFPKTYQQIPRPDLGENIFHAKKFEGEVFDVGTTVEEVTMNNIEQGILNNNKYILTAIEDIKDLQLKVLILQASLTGNVNGDVYVDNLDNIDDIYLSRGIYDSFEKSIYCVDSKGSRIEVLGYAIAIG